MRLAISSNVDSGICDRSAISVKELREELESSSSCIDGAVDDAAEA